MPKSVLNSDILREIVERECFAAGLVVAVWLMAHPTGATLVLWESTCYVSLRQTSIPLEPFEAEFKVLNTGQVSLEMPVSPHLSDLQPSDESLDFRYLTLSLVVLGEPEPHEPDVAAVGYVTLYGSTDRDGSVMVLRPGEWIRVRANMKLHTWPSEPVFARLRGQFWLRRNVYHPQPDGGFTEAQNLYPNVTYTPSIAVHLRGPVRPEKPKQ